MHTRFLAISLILGTIPALCAGADADARARLSGSVVDPSGAPLRHFQLSVFPFGPNPAQSMTDTNGRYAFSWNAQRSGAQDASFCLVARDVARNLAIARDIEEGATNLDLRLQPALVISGQVQDSKGEPLAGATLQASLWTGNTESQFGGRVKPDATGRFTITALPPGRRYTVRASARNLGLLSAACEAESTQTNRLELPPFVFKRPDQKLAGQVMGEDEKPVPGLKVTLRGESQFFATARTDENGRFVFDAVSAGPVRLFASQQKAYGTSTAEAGDTNVVLRLAVNATSSVTPSPQRGSLQGKPLPDLAPLGLAGSTAPVGSPTLLCLFDIEQRPCRRFVRVLAEQYGALKQQGITLLGVQAAITTPESFKEWKDANPMPFPVGRVADKSDNTRWASEVESLPWLILTDKQGRMTAEGFTLEELPDKLKAVH